MGRPCRRCWQASGHEVRPTVSVAGPTVPARTDGAPLGVPCRSGSGCPGWSLLAAKQPLRSPSPKWTKAMKSMGKTPSGLPCMAWSPARPGRWGSVAACRSRGSLRTASAAVRPWDIADTAGVATGQRRVGGAIQLLFHRLGGTAFRGEPGGDVPPVRDRLVLPSRGRGLRLAAAKWISACCTSSPSHGCRRS